MVFKRKNKTSQASPPEVQCHDVDWTTEYMLEGVRDHAWRECRIVEVSRDGVTALLLGTTPDALRTHRVIVAVDVPRASLRVHGEVREVCVLEDGEVRVGLDFAALSAFERAMIDSLLRGSSAPVLATTAA